MRMSIPPGDPVTLDLGGSGAGRRIGGPGAGLRRLRESDGEEAAMRVAASLMTLLLLTQCGQGRRSGSLLAAEQSRGGPTLVSLEIVPARPTPGEEAAATLVLRDEAGVRGFRVILGDGERDVSCDGEKVCRRRVTALVPVVSTSTVTLRIVAENLRGERSRTEREVPLQRESGSVPLSSSASPEATADRKVFFRSGFEQGVTLERARVEGGEWEHALRGSDQGYDWEEALPQRRQPMNRITYLSSGQVPLERVAGARIETVTGHQGTPTRALYMELKEQDPTSRTGTRVQYGIYPDESLRQAYVRYWLKLQPDLATAALPPGVKRSRQVMESKEDGTPRSDFRWGIYIARDPKVPDLFWSTRAQFGDLQRSPSAWTCTSRVPVPVGEWFVLEVFWRLGRENGRLWGAANGQVFVDYEGQTQKDDGLFVWWPFKLYVGTRLDRFEGVPLYQWIDDVEFSYEPPPSLPSSPRGDTYACQKY